MTAAMAATRVGADAPGDDLRCVLSDALADLRGALDALFDLDPVALRDGATVVALWRELARGEDCGGMDRGRGSVRLLTSQGPGSTGSSRMQV